MTRAVPVQALILSAQFWPQFKNETLRLPDEVQESLDAFTKAFEAMKGNRTLSWKPHLGFANIDLEMGDRSGHQLSSILLAFHHPGLV